METVKNSKYIIDLAPVVVKVHVFSVNGKWLAVGKTDFDRTVGDGKERVTEGSADKVTMKDGVFESTIETAEFARPNWKMLVKVQNLSLNDWGVLDAEKLANNELKYFLKKWSIGDLAFEKDREGEAVLGGECLREIVTKVEPLIISGFLQEFRRSI